MGRLRGGWRRGFVTAALAAALLSAADADAQDLGHKVLGTIGLEAGAQPPSGVFVLDRFVLYSSDRVFDRNGERIPIAFSAHGFGNAVGGSFVYRLAPVHTFISASVGVPVAWVSGSAAVPNGRIDRAGVSDLYVEPIRLGWRLPHLDLVTGYAIYLPTGDFDVGTVGGTTKGQLSHEFTLGWALFLDRARTWHASVLGSYDLNQKKIGIDITRGDTVQIQGGAGRRIGIFNFGVVGYALWQVRDDRGADVPQLRLAGHDRDVGLGGELDIEIPPLRGRAIFRYTHDITVASRPLGEMFLVGLSVVAWKPREVKRAGR